MKTVRYSIIGRNRDGVEELDDVNDKRLTQQAFKDGKSVTKITRQITESGPTTAIVIISTEI